MLLWEFCGRLTLCLLYFRDSTKLPQNSTIVDHNYCLQSTVKISRVLSSNFFLIQIFIPQNQVLPQSQTFIMPPKRSRKAPTAIPTASARQTRGQKAAAEKLPAAVVVVAEEVPAPAVASKPAKKKTEAKKPAKKIAAKKKPAQKKKSAPEPRANPEGSPMKKSKGTAAGIPRASGERSPVNGGFPNNQVSRVPFTIVYIHLSRKKRWIIYFNSCHHKRKRPGRNLCIPPLPSMPRKTPHMLMKLATSFRETQMLTHASGRER